MDLDEMDQLERQIDQMEDPFTAELEQSGAIEELIESGQDVDAVLKAIVVKQIFCVSFMNTIIDLAKDMRPQSSLPNELQERKSKLLQKIVKNVVSLQDYLSLSDNRPDFTADSKFLAKQFNEQRKKQVIAHKNKGLAKLLKVKIQQQKEVQKNQAPEKAELSKGQSVDASSYQMKIKFLTTHVYKNINLLKYLDKIKKSRKNQQFEKNKDYYTDCIKILKQLEKGNISVASFVDKHFKLVPSFSRVHGMDKQEFTQKMKTMLYGIDKQVVKLKKLTEKLQRRQTNRANVQRLQIVKEKLRQVEDDKTYIKSIVNYKYLPLPQMTKKQITSSLEVKKKGKVGMDQVKVVITSKKGHSDEEYMLTIPKFSTKEVKFSFNINTTIQQTFKVQGLKNLQNSKIQVVQFGKFLFFKTESQKVVIKCQQFLREQKLSGQSSSMTVTAQISSPMGKDQKQKIFEYQLKKFDQFVPQEGYEIWLLEQFPRLASQIGVTKQSIAQVHHQPKQQPKPKQNQPKKQSIAPQKKAATAKKQEELQFVCRKKGVKNLGQVQVEGWTDKQKEFPQMTCLAMSYLASFQKITDNFISEHGSSDIYNRKVCEQVNEIIYKHKLQVEGNIKNGNLNKQKYVQLVRTNIAKDKILLKQLIQKQIEQDWQEFLFARIKLCKEQIGQSGSNVSAKSDQPASKPKTTEVKKALKKPQFVLRKKGVKNLSGVEAPDWTSDQLLKPELTCLSMSYLIHMEKVTDNFIAEQSSSDIYNRKICEDINDELLRKKMLIERGIKSQEVSKEQYLGVVRASIAKDKKLLAVLMDGRSHEEWQEFLGGRIQMCKEQAG